MDLTKFEKMSAEEVLRWADEEFGDKVALASSFGAEDMVLLDMVLKINPRFRIFTLDTGRLPEETYQLLDEVRRLYNVEIEYYFPETKEVEKMLKEHGPNLFYRDVSLRRLCCNVRKVEPLNRALSGLKAWVCGLRQEQSVTRKNVAKVEIDSAHSNEGRRLYKINPLADWREKDVWDYIRKNNIPYNKLHDKNYPSIGCEPCTRAIKPGEDIRAGRWWWENPENKECGLHAHK